MRIGRTSPAAFLAILLALASGCTGPAGTGSGTVETQVSLGPLALDTRAGSTVARSARLAEYDGEKEDCAGAFIDPNQDLPSHSLFRSNLQPFDSSTRTLSFLGVRAGLDMLIVLDILESRDGGDPVVIARGCVDGQVVLPEAASGSNPTSINNGAPIPLVPATAPAIDTLSAAVVWPGAELVIYGQGFTNVVEDIQVTFAARKSALPVPAAVLAANPWEIHVEVPDNAGLGFVRVQVTARGSPERAQSPFEVIPIHTTIGDPIRVRGRPISIVAQGTRALVVNEKESDQQIAHLSILDLDDRVEFQEQVPLNGQPTDVAYASGLALVTDRSEDSVLAFRLPFPVGDFRPAATIPVGDAPIAIAASGKYAITTNETRKDVSIVTFGEDNQPIVFTTAPISTDKTFPVVAISGTTGYAAAGFALSVIDLASGEVRQDRVVVGFEPSALAALDSVGYVTDAFFRTLSRVDFAEGTVVGSPVTLGSAPSAIAIRGGRAYVTNQGDDTFSVVDLATWSVMGKPAGVGRGPVDLAVAGNFAYVAAADGRSITPVLVSVAEPTGDEYALGPHPRSIAIVGDTAYVVLAGDADQRSSLVPIDLHTGKLVGTPRSLGEWPKAIVAAGEKLYIIHGARPDPSPDAPGNFWCVDSATLGVDWTVRLAGIPWALAVQGGFAYVADAEDDQLHIVNLAARATAPGSPIGIADQPTGVAVDDENIYVSLSGSDAVAVLDLANREEEERIQVGVFPSTIAIAGSRAYVANASDDTVSVIDLATRTEVGGRVPTGRLPGFIAVGERFVYVLSSVTGTVTAIHRQTLESLTSQPTPGFYPTWIAVSEDVGLVANEGSFTIAPIDLRIR